MSTVMALARFQVCGYVRSLRVLQPLILVLLILTLGLAQWPGGPRRVELATGALGDIAALVFPICAWSARSLLDTQPDEQRALSATAAGHPVASAVAGLLAAYAVNLCLGGLLLAIPLVQCVSVGTGLAPTAAGAGLTFLVALAGTLLGAYAQRSIISSPGHSLLALLGGVTAALLLSLGPLSPLSVPMVKWLRAAHDGPVAFIAAFPGLALHLALWSTVLAAGHLLLARRPR
ncbi:hypothetical protein [Thermomonospora echinospora]|uniref:hypothetical protein n=1 Tax=Thermomonospora echinospora TaxID=1992 RepID=UPI0011B0A0EA|nr:hypothetical protein [Thermomonospora echinospora]